MTAQVTNLLFDVGKAPNRRRNRCSAKVVGCARSVRAAPQLSMGGHPYTSVKCRRAMWTQS
jgi:hypothetical protein